MHMNAYTAWTHHICIATSSPEINDNDCSIIDEPAIRLYCYLLCVFLCEWMNGWMNHSRWHFMFTLAFLCVCVYINVRKKEGSTRKNHNHHRMRACRTISHSSTIDEVRIITHRKFCTISTPYMQKKQMHTRIHAICWSHISQSSHYY